MIDCKIKTIKFLENGIHEFCSNIVKYYSQIEAERLRDKKNKMFDIIAKRQFYGKKLYKDLIDLFFDLIETRGIVPINVLDAYYMILKNNAFPDELIQSDKNYEQNIGNELIEKIGCSMMTDFDVTLTVYIILMFINGHLNIISTVNGRNDKPAIYFDGFPSLRKAELDGKVTFIKSGGGGKREKKNICNFVEHLPNIGKWENTISVTLEDEIHRFCQHIIHCIENLNNKIFSNPLYDNLTNLFFELFHDKYKNMDMMYYVTKYVTIISNNLGTNIAKQDKAFIKQNIESKMDIIKQKCNTENNNAFYWVCQYVLVLMINGHVDAVDKMNQHIALFDDNYKFIKFPSLSIYDPKRIRREATSQTIYNSDQSP